LLTRFAAAAAGKRRCTCRRRWETTISTGGKRSDIVFRSPWNEFSFEANFFPIGISQHAVDLLGETGILSARARLQISARRGQFQSASRL